MEVGTLNSPQTQFLQSRALQPCTFGTLEDNRDSKKPEECLDFVDVRMFISRSENFPERSDGRTGPCVRRIVVPIQTLRKTPITHTLTVPQEN